MPQTKPLPQLIAKTKSVTLTPQFDTATLHFMGEKTKTELFPNFRPEDIQLIFYEHYYEPYLFIAGKYELDCSKKHSLALELDKKEDPLFIAGQELPFETGKPSPTVVKLTGEEQVNVRNETFVVVDRMKREVDPQRIPFSPFEPGKMSAPRTGRRFDISLDEQIDFIRKKIVRRPEDLSSITKEEFVIHRRIIAYVPVCMFTFENKVTHEEAATRISALTGETELIIFKKQKQSTAVFSQHTDTCFGEMDFNQPEKEEKKQNQIEPSNQRRSAEFQEIETEKPPEISVKGIPENMTLGFPAVIGGEVFAVGDNVSTVVGDLAIASGSVVDKTLVVKGFLKIGDNCVTSGKLKVLRDVVIGDDSIIDGDVVSGGNVYVGMRSMIRGKIEAAGFVQVGKDSTVQKGLSCLSNESEAKKETPRNVERLRQEVELLKVECAELMDCLQISAAIE